MKRISLTLVAMQMLLAASASTYFCAPDGTQSGNTYGQPCSFSNGIKKLSNPGDTLYLLEGVYYLPNTQISNKNGTNGNNIVISSYPGERAILDFRQTAYSTRGLQVRNTCSYLHVKDLTLRYSGKNNLYNEGSYCTFENLDIYGSADTGCQMKYGGGNLIIHVDSHDNFDYQHKNDNGDADFGGNADGFADKQHSGASNHYIGCRAWNNSDDGWDFFDRDNSDDVTPTIIEGCICYQNGPTEYDMRNHARYETDKAWFDNIDGQTIVNRYGENQKVTLLHYPNHGNGNGFKLGGNYSTHNVTVHHCLSVANTVKGFDQNNDAGEMKIYNNTGYDNGNNMGFHNSNYGTLHIQNNISFQGRKGDLVRAQTIVVNDHNSWNNIPVSASDFLSTDTTYILSQRNTDGTFPETITSLFALAQESPLIDAGIDVGYTYTGSAPDLGWQESANAISTLRLIDGPAEQFVSAGDSIQTVIIGWKNCDTKPSSTGKPETITRKVSNNGKTLTFTGVINEPGTYTIVTASACNETDTIVFTIHVLNNTDTGIQQEGQSTTVQKQLTPNGIIILRGDKRYTITGQRLGTN